MNRTLYVASLFFALTWLGGCKAPEFQVSPGSVQVGPASEPAVIIERGAIQVGPASQPAVIVEREAIKLEIQPGAITVQAPVSATTAPLPEGPLNTMATWIGIGVVLLVALVAYPVQRARRLKKLQRQREDQARRPPPSARSKGTVW